MLFSDSYNEIKLAATGEYKELGSKFIAHTFLVKNRKEVEANLANIKLKYKTANHFCFAYILNPDYSIIKVSDDGEPNSTAGKPILTQLKKHNLTNVLAVVVRHFGGKKLGIAGLIRSYKNATINALQKTTIINKKIKEQYDLEFYPNNMSFIMGIIKKYNLETHRTSYENKYLFTVNILKKDTIYLLSLLKNNNINFKFKKIV